MGLWKRKADANKHVAQDGTAAIVTTSALVPVVLLDRVVPHSNGKVAPSILGAIRCGGRERALVARLLRDTGETVRSSRPVSASPKCIGIAPKAAQDPHALDPTGGRFGNGRPRAVRAF